MYPEIIIRELIPNALIHQDFRISGSGPMLEIFKDRIEIFNLGRPLVDTERFIEKPKRRFGRIDAKNQHLRRTRQRD